MYERGRSDRFTPAHTTATATYRIATKFAEYEPIIFSAKTPQQELKEKLAALDVDSLPSETISALLKVLG
jgi:hypothetical protein